MSEDLPTNYERTRPENLPVRQPGRQTAGLVVLAGPDIGRQIALSSSRLVVGRASANDFQLDDDAVSRTHAEFREEWGSWLVRDLGSTNGTFVNDARLAAERTLADGDRVRIGATTFKFLAVGNSEAAYHDELYRQRTRDALTGAFNRAYFQEQLTREWAKARRGGALALLLIDVDHFKRINDTHGHAAGDAVLRELPARVGPLLEAGATFARYGGEEFALLLPGRDAGAARALAERIRQAVAVSPFLAGPVPLPVTVSIGLAETQATMSGAAALVARADESLYAAKRAGRNRVEG